jgi:hypothetical protein
VDFCFTISKTKLKLQGDLILTHANMEEVKTNPEFYFWVVNKIYFLKRGLEDVRLILSIYQEGINRKK